MQRSRKNDFVCRMVLTSEILLCKEDCCFKAKYSSVSNALILPLCHPASHLRCSGSLDHLSRFSGVYFFFHPQNASFIIALFWGRNCVSQIIWDGLHCFKIFVKHNWKTKLTVRALGWFCPSVQWVASYLTSKANRGDFISLIFYFAVEHFIWLW